MPPIHLTPSPRRPGRFDIGFRVHFGPPQGPVRKPTPRKGGEPEREPVEPPRPKNLSGGAAAALEFDA